MNALEKFLTEKIQKYAPAMDIHLNPGLVTFYHQNKSIQSEPVLCIDDKAKKIKILGWDCDIPTSVDCIRINVFNPKEFEKHTSLSQTYCIGIFFDIAMKKLRITKTMLRPIIRVFNMSSLPDIKTSIENGVAMCGASKVEYV